MGEPCKLNGAWELALLETQSPHQIPNFKATTIVVSCTVKPQSDKPQNDQAPQYLVQRAPDHHAEVDGYWPGEEDEELDPGVSSYRAHEAPHTTSPLPQIAAETKRPTEGYKKAEQPIDVDEIPEPIKDRDKPAKDADKKPDEKKKDKDRPLPRTQHTKSGRMLRQRKRLMRFLPRRRLKRMHQRRTLTMRRRRRRS